MLCSFTVTATVDRAPARHQVPDCQTPQLLSTVSRPWYRSGDRLQPKPTGGHAGIGTQVSLARELTPLQLNIGLQFPRVFFFFLEVVLLYTLLLQLFCRFFVLFLNILDQDMTCPAPRMLLTD